MLWYYLLFFFLTVGAKLLLALVMIYFLLPADRLCSRCDGETLLLGGSRAARFRTRLFLGRVQWRWCAQCGWEGMARRIAGPSPTAGVPADSPSSSRR